MSLSSRWIDYGVRMSAAVATQSKDPSTKVGCVILDRLGRFVSAGYNGFPRGVIDHPDRYEHKETKYRLVVHAEANAILTAGRDLSSFYLFTSKFPCSECTKLIIQSGVTTVYCPPPSKDEPWAKDAEWSTLMMTEAQVKVMHP